MKLFEDTTMGVLENFQKAYLNQIGKRMTIGSEEYTLTSVFSYVLAAYIALINKAYDNRFLDTASGQYLDNIAKQYNLDRKPVSFGNPFFEGTFNLDAERYYAAGEYIISLAGHDYSNSVPINIHAVNEFNRFTCLEDHSEYLDAKTIIEALENIGIQYSHIIGNGLQNCPTEMIDDEEFREYIRQNKRLYNPGIAESFEAAARAYADYIIDAKVIRQSDSTYFEPGKVDLMIKVNDNAVRDSFAANGLDCRDLAKVINDLNILVVGQELRIRLASSKAVPVYRVAVYVPKAYSSHVYDRYIYPKHAALAYYYNERKLKIGQSLYMTEFLSDMARPLSDISTNPADFGISQDEFDAIGSFCIRGYNLSSPDKVDPTNSLGYLELYTSGFNYAVTFV